MGTDMADHEFVTSLEQLEQELPLWNRAVCLPLGLLERLKSPTVGPAAPCAPAARRSVQSSTARREHVTPFLLACKGAMRATSPSRQPYHFLLGWMASSKTLGTLPCKQGEPSMDRLTPVQSIREKCKDCTSNQLREIRECRIKTCALWPYRMGKRPKPEDLVLLTRKGVQ